MESNAKNRITAFMLALILLMGVFALTAPAEAGSLFEEALITEEGVNMRLRPDTESPVILKFDEAVRVGVYCEEVEGWYRIIYGNYLGYVSKDFVFLSSADTLTGNALADGISIYRNPAEYSTAVATLNAGSGVMITGLAGDYYEVMSGEDTVGYVAKDELQLSNSKTASSMLKLGMEGVEVKKMQTELRKRGFLGASATGYFGDQTLEAVKDFQRKAGISADGIAGAGTLELLYGDNDIRTNAAEKAGISGKVQLSEWSTIKNVFKRYSYATVTDVATGIQYKVYRFGGWHHADCVPASKADTEKMKKANGGKWGWNRRAIWVTAGGKTYAASQNNQPHMVDYDKNDNFPGHFCIHFNDSLVHENNKECPRHQAAVQQAYKKAQ
ncbi:MAG: peptidoglycan-binding protein [Oscillospiraceae bacterium]|nr:peptidoglycan-binding protein [Oscillospiraceae bacterium]